MVAKPKSWYFVSMSLLHNPLGGGFVQAFNERDARDVFAKRYRQSGEHAKLFVFLASEINIVPGPNYRDCMMTTTELEDLMTIANDKELYLRILTGKEERRLHGWYNCTIQDQTTPEEPYRGCCFIEADSYCEAREKCKQLYPFPEPAFVIASHGETKVHPKYSGRLIELAEYQRMNSFLATHGMKAFFHLLETGADV